MSNLKELSSYFADRFEMLADLNALKTSMRDICHYSMFPPGKCFRAGLTLLAAQSLADPGEREQAVDRVMGFATALEVLHAASLVHDDLPALDDDALRRGRPSVHRKFGEAEAILAGDTLLIFASQVLAKHSAACLQQLPNQPGAACQHFALTELFHSAAIAICEGQLLDIQSTQPGRGGSAEDRSEPALLPDKELSAEKELELRHHLKTGSLIRAAVIGPSLFIPAAEQEIVQPALEQFSRNLGILFQITDDLLEATSNAETLGKNVDSDAKKGTPTYVSVYGLAAAQEIASKTAEAAKSALKQLPKLSPLTEVVDLVLYRKN